MDSQWKHGRLIVRPTTWKRMSQVLFAAGDERHGSVRRCASRWERELWPLRWRTTATLLRLIGSRGVLQAETGVAPLSHCSI